MAVLHVLGLNGPSQLQVSGQDGLGGGRVDDLVDSSGIASANITNHGRSRIGACQCIKTGQLGQGGSVLVFLDWLGSLGGVGSGLCGRVGGGCLGSSDIGLGLVTELTQRTNDVRQRVGQIELQVSGTLQQLAHALGLFHTRELKQDAASALQLLDIGLYHAKAVDTVAQYLVGVVDHAVDLIVEDVLHLTVIGSGVGSDLVDSAEDLGQVALGSEFLVLLAEGAHEVVLSGAAACHIVDGLVKLLVWIIVRERAQDVGH